MLATMHMHQRARTRKDRSASTARASPSPPWLVRGVEVLLWTLLLMWLVVNSLVQEQRDSILRLIDRNNLDTFKRRTSTDNSTSSSASPRSSSSKDLGRVAAMKDVGVYINSKNATFIIGIDKDAAADADAVEVNRAGGGVDYADRPQDEAYAPFRVYDELSGVVNSLSIGLLGTNITQLRVDRMGTLVDKLQERALEELERDIAAAVQAESMRGMSHEDKLVAKLKMRTLPRTPLVDDVKDVVTSQKQQQQQQLLQQKQEHVMQLRGMDLPKPGKARSQGLA